MQVSSTLIMSFNCFYYNYKHASQYESSKSGQFLGISFIVGVIFFGIKVYSFLEEFL